MGFLMLLASFAAGGFRLFFICIILMLIFIYFLLFDDNKDGCKTYMGYGKVISGERYNELSGKWVKYYYKE